LAAGSAVVTPPFPLPDDRRDIRQTPAGIEATNFRYWTLPLVNRTWTGAICASAGTRIGQRDTDSGAECAQAHDGFEIGIIQHLGPVRRSGYADAELDDVAKETCAICEQVLTDAQNVNSRAGRDRRLRITVVTPYFPTAEGSYRGHSAFQTLRFLKDRAEVRVICPVPAYPRLKWLTPKSYQPMDLSYRPREIETVYFEYPAIPVITRPVNGLICEQFLLPYVRDWRPDVILNYWLYPEGYSAVRVGRTLGVPVIVGAIGSDVRRITNGYARHLTGKTVRDAAGVIAVSEELRQQTIALGVPGDRVTTILNGCDGGIFRPGDRDEARRELGLGGGELILYAGRLHASKGLAELMEAFTGLGRERPGARLALIGEGVYGDWLKTRAAEAGLAGRVLMPGRMESARVAEWMRACDVFCLPSYSEGCPNVVIEALASGRPVVATDVGGIPELVKDGCGILIPARDAERLRAALHDALAREWPASRIAAAVKRDWDQVAEETLAVCWRAAQGAQR
jgi:teichuronic acid biosynthesis glycosyltransferase TuaC